MKENTKLRLKLVNNIVFTLNDFINLESAWSDYLNFHGGVILMRIHPKHLRSLGDENVPERIYYLVSA